jgi:hypothetical protein
MPTPIVAMPAKAVVMNGGPVRPTAVRRDLVPVMMPMVISERPHRVSLPHSRPHRGDVAVEIGAVLSLEPVDKPVGIDPFVTIPAGSGDGAPLSLMPVTDGRVR